MLEKFKNFQGEIFLDTETFAGLKGPLLFIQLGFGKGSEVLVLEFPFNPSDLETLETLLNDPKNMVLGFNTGFDIGKLLVLFKRQTPFSCQIIDLRHHLLRTEELKGLPLLGQGKFSSIRFVHESVVDTFREVLIKRLTEQLPKINNQRIGEVKTVKSESFPKSFHKKRGEKYFDILFRFKFSTKMKDLVPFFRKQLDKYLVFYPEIEVGTATGEVFYLPKNVFIDKDQEITVSFDEENRKGKRWKEDTLLPFITQEEKSLFEALIKANTELMKNEQAYQRAINYSKLDVLMLYAIYDFVFESKFSHSNLTISEDLERLRPNYLDLATHQAACLRFFGLPLDLGVLERVEKELTEKKERIEIEVGINPRSSQQRIEFMWDSYKSDIQMILSQEDIKSANREVLMEGLADDLFREEKRGVIKGLIEYGTICLELNQLKKLKKGEGFFYPSIFIGESQGGRNKATGGLNILGISKKGSLRECFLTLGGGDLDNLELRVMASVYQIKKMLEAIDENKDLHTLTVQAIFSEEYGENSRYSYEDLIKIKEDRKHPSNKDFKAKRHIAKTFIFAFSYGATPVGLASLLECSVLVAEDYVKKFYNFYPELARAHASLKKDFCTYGPEGEWSVEAVRQMASECRDIFGTTYKCDFDKKICIFLAENISSLARETWDSTDVKISKKIMRSDLKGEQTIQESIKTAIRGSIIAKQAYLSRKYLNLLIQAPASAVIQILSARVWQKYHLFCLTIHDEAIYPPQRLAENLDFDLIGETFESNLIGIRGVLKGLTIDFRAFDNWSER